jgi:hypothetical protein
MAAARARFRAALNALQRTSRTRSRTSHCSSTRLPALAKAARCGAHSRKNDPRSPRSASSAQLVPRRFPLNNVSLQVGLRERPSGRLMPPQAIDYFHHI